MRSIIFLKFIFLSLLFVGSTALCQEQASLKNVSSSKVEIIPAEWSELATQLVADGISRDLVVKVYSSPKVPYTFIPFAVAPVESHRIYQSFFEKARLQTARNQLYNNQTYFRKAEQLYGVPAELICAILYVETNFGQMLGQDLVVYRLSRLAALAYPDNVQKNYERLIKEGAKVTLNDVQSRAQYLFTTFYPQLRTLFLLAEQQRLSILELRGSTAGAFGIPQFLPLTFEQFAIDANNNGHASLFEMEDAIFSTANFLRSNGWRSGLSDEQARAVLWNYNRSHAYTATLLKVSKQLKQRP